MSAPAFTPRVAISEGELIEIENRVLWAAKELERARRRDEPFWLWYERLLVAAQLREDSRRLIKLARTLL